MFASNTLDTQNSPQKLQEIAQHFFQTLSDHHITINAYSGNGIMILEQLIKTENITEINQFPAGQSAINLFVVGDRIYHMIYSEKPSSIMIENEQLASAYHFFFTLFEKKSH